MRPVILIFLLVANVSTFAQRSELTSARALLTENNYKSALSITNALTEHAETRNDPEAWFLRGVAYLMQAVDTSAAVTDAKDESFNSFERALTLNPAYSTELNKPFYTASILRFNSAAASYSAMSYTQAYKEFLSVHSAYMSGGGKRFKDNKEFKALDIDARKNAAYTAINAGHDEWATPLLKDLIKTDAKNDPNIYQALTEIYQTARRDEQELALIKMAKKQFPDNATFRNMEINYLLHHSKQEELLSKLEDAVSKDPSNAALLFNLGNAYTKRAFPVNEQGKQATVPSNFLEIFGKAEVTYHKAVQLAPEEADYSYNYGMLYYNNAGKYARQINAAESGASTTELEKARNAELLKAQPHFERSYMLLVGRDGDLTETERTTFRNSMLGLKEIYGRTGQNEKKAGVEAALARWK
jgi:Flp pilus assembly protein TadD